MAERSPSHASIAPTVLQRQVGCAQALNDRAVKTRAKIVGSRSIIVWQKAGTEGGRALLTNEVEQTGQVDTSRHRPHPNQTAFAENQ
jgi:hypothetical protein